LKQGTQNKTRQKTRAMWRDYSRTWCPS